MVVGRYHGGAQLWWVGYDLTRVARITRQNVLATPRVAWFHPKVGWQSEAEPDERSSVWLGGIEVKQSVRLDILIQHRSEERLPGITVDVSMVDPNQQEKGHWRVWFDTSEVTEATVTQFTHILEDVGYEEGDGFYVEVRHPVPPEERSEYREFSQVS